MMDPRTRYAPMFAHHTWYSCLVLTTSICSLVVAAAPVITSWGQNTTRYLEVVEWAYFVFCVGCYWKKSTVLRIRPNVSLLQTSRHIWRGFYYCYIRAVRKIDILIVRGDQSRPVPLGRRFLSLRPGVVPSRRGLRRKGVV